MIHSMTGYAAASRDLGTAVINLEIKSVNSRYLDIGFRLSEDLRFLEMPLRERITERIARGKIECRGYLQAQPAQGHASRQRLPDSALLAELGSLDAAVRKALPQAAPLSVAEVLRWPGVLADDSLSGEQLQAAAQGLFATLLDEFVASREREGAKLADVLRNRAARMRECVAAAEPLLPAALAAYRERLATKLREAVANLDEERIRQEVGVFAAKIDVAEEIARLVTHLDELDRVLKKGGAVGKRLDFLMQELNREANTLSSKSVSAEVTAIALDLKLLVEQMREQVQNLE
ncbi:YicC/YloC family endoribonuclease [Sulfuritalea sp.]|uniref:YicC/YloC family endoribonuclease n=1 Tax=Sulfuritalea sp. TaxID=2480090 RepID=UPI00260137E4|nr:YicC/YloC family endoribonuclease [Sulfuritalea sp.]